MREDAWTAHQLKESIDLADQQRMRPKEKKYDYDRGVDAIARAVFERNPYSLRADRQENFSRLKQIAEKYNLFISDLDLNKFSHTSR